MNYQVAICDDSDIDRQYMDGLVRKWALNRGYTVQSTLFESAENFLFHYAEKKDYDILLLDIEMGAMDGVTMAKRLRRENDFIQIIFVTGYSDYISEGYEVATLQYLMKPIKEEKFFEVLDRAAVKVTKNEKVLTFETGSEMVRVPVYQIRYVEVFGNYVTIHASDASYDRTLVMDSLEKAGFMENLEKMPNGIETYLYKDYDKDGVNISGREAQKIAIARALYKDAPFIILDEPTAALDPVAEAEIYSRFNEITGDKTAIYISHRLSSCKFCDEIIVFHEGKIVQQGMHEEFLADKKVNIMNYGMRRHSIT